MSDYAEDSHSQEFNTVAAILQLQNQKLIRDAELEALRDKLTSISTETSDSIKDLENSVTIIRDMARDAMHISVGVDGKNGLRGSISTLSEQVNVLVKEFAFLRQTADSYVEMKNLILKFFTTAAVGLFFQFAAAIWYFSGQHQQQQAMRDDLNKVLSYVAKQQEASKSLK
jgi:hypothetical protein